MGNYDSAAARRRFKARRNVLSTRTVGGVAWPVPELAPVMREDVEVPLPKNSGVLAEEVAWDALRFSSGMNSELMAEPSGRPVLAGNGLDDTGRLADAVANAAVLLGGR